MTYYDILLSERWEESKRKVARLIIRKENRLLEYKKQGAQKEQYLSAMESEINELKEFLTNADSVIKTQSELLQDSDRIKRRSIELENQNFIMEQYMSKTGMDTSLFQWMKREDFY